MITINKIEINERPFLVGKIGKVDYSVNFSEEAQKVVLDAKEYFEKCETMVEVDKLYEATLKQLKAFDSSVGDSLTDVLKGDLMYNADKATYHIMYKDKIGKTPVHNFFVEKMREAADKGFDPKPWLIFWVRLMRNPLYKNDTVKVEVLVNYLSAPYTSEKRKEELIEKGYAEAIATEMATFDQISITEQGILAAFKYVNLMNDKFEVKVNEETGEQTIEKVDRYKRVLEVDEVTGEITKDEPGLPEFSEDIYFQPPIQGTSGDAFSCRAIGDDKDSNPGHIVRVGMVHELPNSFSGVNTNDSSSCVRGLHIGRLSAA